MMGMPLEIPLAVGLDIPLLSRLWNVNLTPFRSMTGRWGNKTFQSNTSHHRQMGYQLPVATSLVAASLMNRKYEDLKD